MDISGSSHKALNMILAVLISLCSCFIMKATETQAGEQGHFGHVIPIHYSLDFTFNGPHRFSGRVALYFFTRSAKLETIQLHAARSIDVHVITILSYNGRYDRNVTYRHLDDDTLILRLSKPVQPRRLYRLNIWYNGEPRIDDVSSGLKYERCSFENDIEDGYNDGEMYLISTAFQMRHAREAFPCIDVPSLKTTFQACITHSDDATSEANDPLIWETVEPGGFVKRCFKRSMRLPTYLFAFSVFRGYEKFETSINTYFNRSLPFSVYFPNVTSCESFYFATNANFTIDADQISQNVPKIVQEVEKFFELPIRLEKLTFIVHRHIFYMYEGVFKRRVPLALENHGLVSFDKKAFHPSVIVHEIVHHFIGNAVTISFWDDMDFQEGLTSYVSAKVYQNLYRFNPAQNRRVTWFLRRSAAVESSLNKNRFESITDIVEKSYTKSTSIFNMLENVTTPDGLRNVIYTLVGQRYLRSACWEWFERLLNETAMDGGKSARFFRKYHAISGFPVIKVHRYFGFSSTGEPISSIYVLEQVRYANLSAQFSPRNETFDVRFDVYEPNLQNGHQTSVHYADKFPVIFYRLDPNAKILINPLGTSLQLTLYETPQYKEIFSDLMNLTSELATSLDYDLKAELLDQFSYGIHTNLLPIEKNPDPNSLKEALNLACKLEQPNGTLYSSLRFDKCPCQILNLTELEQPNCFRSRYASYVNGFSN